MIAAFRLRFFFAPPSRSAGGDGRGRLPNPVDAQRASNTVPATDPDASLVARIRAGDANALGALFRQYYGKLCGYARRLVGTDEIAEELVMDVFLRLWHRCATFASHGTIRTYLFRAVHHAATNALRDEATRARLLRTASGDVLPAFGNMPASPATDMERAELRAAIERTAATFSERVRYAFGLRWEQGLSTAEIARIMGVSEKAAEQYLVRAARTLRAALIVFRDG